MKRFRFGKRGLAPGVAVLAALATAGGVAYATIPGPGNVYAACRLVHVGPRLLRGRVVRQRRSRELVAGCCSFSRAFSITSASVMKPRVSLLSSQIAQSAPAGTRYRASIIALPR
jgi:hypothetical protein